MSLFALALAYVRRRPMVSGLTIVSLALGTALILVVLNVKQDVERSFLASTGGYDLIAGAPGSETALVLGGLYHADRPRGNVAYRAYLDLLKQPGVTAAFPFALGDSCRGARIVGTTPDFLEQKREGAPVFSFADGKLFEKDFEIVAGAAAAKRLGLAVGSRIVGSHGAGPAAGAEHGEHPYTVVGVLAPSGTPHDRALFTTLGSYWKIHGQFRPDPRAFGGPEPEITLLLLRVAKPRLFELQNLLPKRFGLAVARPAEVLQGIFTEVLEPIETVILLYGWAVVVVATMSVITSLYLATLVRQRDLALLRALGARRWEIFTVVVFEALIMLVIGAALGVLLSQAGGVFLRQDLETRFGLGLGMFRFTPAEVAALAATLLLGLAASLIPALTAYRHDVSTLLKRG